MRSTTWWTVIRTLVLVSIPNLSPKPIVFKNWGLLFFCKEIMRSLHLQWLWQIHNLLAKSVGFFFYDTWKKQLQKIEMLFYVWIQNCPHYWSESKGVKDKNGTMEGCTNIMLLIYSSSFLIKNLRIHLLITDFNKCENESTRFEWQYQIQF